MQLQFQFMVKINVVELRLPLSCTLTRSQQALFQFQLGLSRGRGELRDCSLRGQHRELCKLANWYPNYSGHATVSSASPMLFCVEIFISCACCRQLWRKLVRHAQHLNTA